MSQRTITIPMEVFVIAAAKTEEYDDAFLRKILVFKSESDSEHYKSDPSWLHVGSTEVTTTIIEGEELTAERVAGLRAQVKSIRAEAEARATAIEGEIQKLLAIEHVTAEVES